MRALYAGPSSAKRNQVRRPTDGSLKERAVSTTGCATAAICLRERVSHTPRLTMRNCLFHQSQAAILWLGSLTLLDPINLAFSVSPTRIGIVSVAGYARPPARTTTRGILSSVLE